MSEQEHGWAFVVQRWRDSFRAMYWVFVHFWPASLLGMGGLFAEIAGAVKPPGAGGALFLGWFFTAMLVAHDRSLNGATGEDP